MSAVVVDLISRTVVFSLLLGLTMLVAKDSSRLTFSLMPQGGRLAVTRASPHATTAPGLGANAKGTVSGSPGLTHRMAAGSCPSCLRSLNNITTLAPSCHLALIMASSSSTCHPMTSKRAAAMPARWPWPSVATSPAPGRSRASPSSRNSEAKSRT